MIKRYKGPFRQKSKSLITVPAEQVMRSDRHAYYNQAPFTRYTPGINPASYVDFMTLITPEFRKLQADDWVIQCPYHRIQEVNSYVPCGITSTLYNGTNPVQVSSSVSTNMVEALQGSTAFPSIGSGFQTGLDRARDEVLTRVYSKANSANADMIIELTQLMSTGKMFLGAGRTLLSLATNANAFLRKPGLFLRRGEDRKIRIPPDGREVNLSSLAGWWCELRFGWGPLLYTILGIQEALARDDLDTVKRITYRALEEYQYVAEKTNVVPVTYNTFTTNFLYTTKIEYKSNLRAGILVEDGFTLARALGLDVRYIPIALWDAVPLSFIVDRFINCGNYIRSLQPIPATAFGGSWVVEKFDVTTTRKAEYVAMDKSSGSGSTYKRWAITGGTNSATQQRIGTVRTIYEQSPLLPTLRHDWSQFKNLYNLIDAIMLAIQRLKR